MYKKTISIFMAIILFTSSIVVNLNFQRKTVYAGSVIPSFNGSFNQSLSVGYTNGVPVYSNTNNNPESAMFSFSMENDPNNTPFVQGTYNLSYPVKDDTILNMTIEKDSTDTATVTYKMTNSAGTQLNFTETAAKPDYTIFSYNKGGYENQSAFSANGTVSTNNYVVTKKIFNPDDTRDANGTPNTPVFHVKKGTGFSFEYNGVYSHIKWDDLTNNFQFYTNGLLKGNIYDVSLDYKSSDGSYNVSDKTKVFTGISTSTGTYQGQGELADKFIAAPFANSSTATNPTEYFEEDIVSSDSGLTPGDPINGIKFGFTVPKVWDPATKSYAKNLSSSEYDMNILMEIGGRQVRMTNVLNSSLSVTVSGSDTSTYTPSVIPINSNGQFYVTLSNLPIGVAYENVRLEPEIFKTGTKTSDVIYNYTDVPYGYIFTFPNYRVFQVNSKFYVELTPFKSYDGKTLLDGTYLLKTNDKPSVTQWSDGKDLVYFPLPLDPATSAGAKYKYQIFFNPLTVFPDINNVTYNNYLTHYMHSEQYEFTVPQTKGDLSLPENFTITDYSLSSKPGVDKKTEMVLSMDMNWDIVTALQLKKMMDASTLPNNEINVKYSLSNYLKPEATDTNKQLYTYVGIKIYKGDYTDPETSIVTKDAILADYTLSYNKDLSSPYKTINGTLLQHTFRADANSEVYYADINFDVRAEYKDGIADATDPTPIYFEYPNIYFMTVDTVALDRGDGNGYVGITGGSTFESITLNDITEEEVPPPQNLSLSNATKSSFDANWSLSGEGLYEFLLDKYTLESLKDVLNEPTSTTSDNKIDAYYNIYICSSESFMKNTFSKYPLPDFPDTSDGLLPTRKDVSYRVDGRTLNKPYTLHAQDVEYEETARTTTINADTNGTSKLPIDKLREEKGVVMVEHYPIYNETLSTGDYNKDTYAALKSIVQGKTNLTDNLSVVGLDSNTKYFVMADLVVENQETDTKRIVKSSILSPLDGITTLSDMNIPDDKDKIPPSPTLKIIDESVDSLKLGWDPVVVTDSQGNQSRMEYDIIRLEAFQMDEKYLSTRDRFKYTWDHYLPPNVPSKAGYRTNIYNSNMTPGVKNILKYDPETGGYVDAPLASLESSVVSFTEGGLTPNKIYFYYVRSIRVIEEDGVETLTYSTWSRISGTTTNIQSPTNLKINTQYQTYEHKTETVLNFDAPIIDTNQIGVAYDLYYTIKEDGGAWSSDILLDPNTLRAGVTGAYNQTTGMTNFNYKITGLKQGTSYTFKVKMYDKTTGASSLYSNEARAKTDMDQDDYDDDETTDDWQDYLIELLMKIFDDNYWITEDTSGKREIIYREEKFPGVIATSTDSFVTLVPAKDTAVNTYYIPANSLKALNSANKGLKVVYKNTEYYLTPNALNDVLNGIKKDVDAGSIKDFYIKLTVSGYVSGAINAEPALSDVMTFDVALVGFDVPIKQFERDAYAELVTKMTTDTDLQKVLDKIKQYVKEDKTNLEMEAYLLEQVGKLSDHLIDIVDEDFHDDLAGSKYNYNLPKLDGQVAVSLLNADANANVNALRLQNDNWIVLNVLNLGTTRTFTTYDPGVYVFTGKVLSLPGIEMLPYAETIKNLFNKYGLDEYLGSGNTFNPNAPLTGQMVMGSTAKIIGMNSLADPIAYLKTKGINATERTARTTIKSGDMIYYLMKTYEAKTNTKIENMNITNYGASANMKGLTAQNKKSIQIAAQIGLVRDPNFNANVNMTVKDYLYYLNRLNEIIKL